MDLLRKEEVSIKILKNHPAYFRQELLEIAILMILNSFYTIKERSKILRITDQFLYNNHLCIVTELLGTDLFYLMKENKNKGFSVRTIRKFLFQLLKALRTLSQANVVHCVLKTLQCIHIFNHDIIELLKLFWDYHIRVQLICGHLDVLLENFS